MPVEGVIPDLGRIVEDAGLRRIAGRDLDDVFQGFICEVGRLDQAIQLADIGVVMLAMVEIQCLGRDMRRQGIFGVGQVGEGESHEGPHFKSWGTDMRRKPQRGAANHCWCAYGV